jgi:release factor glutamine methyltransferase
VFVANLPYIPNSEELPHSVRGFEPQLALVGGEQGTEVIERFLAQLSRVSYDEERVQLEVGAGQAERV